MVHRPGFAYVEDLTEMSSKGLCAVWWSWLLVATLVVGAAAQDKPDFSGRWVLEDSQQPTRDLPRIVTIQQPVVRTDAFGAPKPPAFLALNVTREFETGSRSEVYYIGTEGGTVSGVGGSGQPHTRSRVTVQWRGDRLHIDTALYDPGLRIEHREVWWLDGRGRLQMTVVDQQPGADRTTETESTPRG